MVATPIGQQARTLWARCYFRDIISYYVDLRYPLLVIDGIAVCVAIEPRRSGTFPALFVIESMLTSLVCIVLRHPVTSDTFLSV